MAANLHVIIYWLHSSGGRRETKKQIIQAGLFCARQVNFSKSCRQIWWRVNQRFILFILHLWGKRQIQLGNWWGSHVEPKPEFWNNKTVARLSRGTQGLFSVKYLFGKANIAKNFLKMYLTKTVFFHVQFSRLIWLISYDFLKLIFLKILSTPYRFGYTTAKVV